MIRMPMREMAEVFCWWTVLLSSSISFGQNAGAKRQLSGSAGLSHSKPEMIWDVASIRESHDGGSSFIDNMPKTSYYHAENVPLFGVILSAYDIKLIQNLENVPPWMITTRYTITAKSDDATDEALMNMSDSDVRSEKRHMMQQLLAERFKLKIHPETRISTTYELVATSRAAKLMTPVQGDGAKTFGTCQPSHFSRKGIEIESQGCPFSFLVGQLKQWVGADIVDDSGMKGMYAYHLMQSPSAWNQATGEEQYPDTATAVREQLGLELKKTKAPVTFWVIDHIERPTPN